MLFRSTPEGKTGMTALYETVKAGKSVGDTGTRTAEDLLAALHASELGQRLNLPVDEKLVDINRHWSIS